MDSADRIEADVPTRMTCGKCGRSVMDIPQLYCGEKWQCCEGGMTATGFLERPKPTPPIEQSGLAGDVAAFADAILHGDDCHRDWLKEAAQCWIEGMPVPAPRSSTTDKARDEALEEAGVDDLAALLRSEHWRVDQGYYRSVAMSILDHLKGAAK